MGSVMKCMIIVTIPAVTPTFSSTSHPVASPEVPRDTSSSHMPLGSHVIHPRAPSHTMPREPISHPRWVRLQESPPRLSTPSAPDEPESSIDLQIDSTAMTEDLSILQGLLSGLPMSLWSAVPDMTDTDGHWCPIQWHLRYVFHLDLTAPTGYRASHTLLRSSFHSLIILLYAYIIAQPYRPLSCI